MGSFSPYDAVELIKSAKSNGNLDYLLICKEEWLLKRSGKDLMNDCITLKLDDIEV